MRTLQYLFKFRNHTKFLVFEVLGLRTLNKQFTDKFFLANINYHIERYE